MSQTNPRPAEDPFVTTMRRELKACGGNIENFGVRVKRLGFTDQDIVRFTNLDDVDLWPVAGRWVPRVEMQALQADRQRRQVPAATPGPRPTATIATSPAVPPRAAAVPPPMPYSSAELTERTRRIVGSAEAKGQEVMAMMLATTAGVTIDGAIDVMRVASGKAPLNSRSGSGQSSGTTTTAAPPRESPVEIFARRAREAQAHREGRPVETASPSQPAAPETSSQLYAASLRTRARLTTRIRRHRL